MLPLGIPAHEYFKNKNQYTGSVTGFRYRIAPTDEGLLVSIWEGKFNYENSEMTEERTFSHDPDGLSAAADWLYDEQQKRSNQA